MSENQDPLQYLPMERWGELMDVFKSDWPRGICGYATLVSQKQWAQQGIDYKIKIYCPYGDVRNGMVAINPKANCYEAIIQCPKNNTDELSEAIKKTKVIDWSKRVLVPNAAQNVIDCLQNIVEHIGINFEMDPFLHTFILEHELEEVSLPPNITFGLVRLEHLNLVDSAWPYQYPGSAWHFELLIKAKCGYGLFINEQLISWVFIKEVGPLQHLYTVEEHRKNGNAELLLKKVSNMLLRENKPVIAFCFQDNIKAFNLYKKLGFVEGEPIAWCYLDKNTKGLAKWRLVT